MVLVVVVVEEEEEEVVAVGGRSLGSGGGRREWEWKCDGAEMGKKESEREARGERPETRAKSKKDEGERKANDASLSSPGKGNPQFGRGGSSAETLGQRRARDWGGGKGETVARGGRWASGGPLGHQHLRALVAQTSRGSRCPRPAHGRTGAYDSVDSADSFMIPSATCRQSRSLNCTGGDPLH